MNTLVTWADDNDASNTFLAEVIPAERWNTWAMPWFRSWEMERIAESQATMAGDGDQFRWNANLGEYGGWECDNSGEDETVWRPVPEMDNGEGVTLYQPGSGWMWREIEQPSINDAGDFAEYWRFHEEVEQAQEHQSNLPTTRHHYARIDRQEPAHIGHMSTFGAWWCDTCNSPYCELA